MSRERRNQTWGLSTRKLEVNYTLFLWFLVIEEHLSVLARQLTSSALRGDYTSNISDDNVLFSSVSLAGNFTLRCNCPEENSDFQAELVA